MKASGVLTLQQIASHHSLRYTRVIADKFSEIPFSLGDLAVWLSASSEVCNSLKFREALLSIIRRALCDS